MPLPFPFAFRRLSKPGDLRGFTPATEDHVYSVTVLPRGDGVSDSSTRD